MILRATNFEAQIGRMNPGSGELKTVICTAVRLGSDLEENWLHTNFCHGFPIKTLNTHHVEWIPVSTQSRGLLVRASDSGSDHQIPLTQYPLPPRSLVRGGQAD